jgi:hypothetical protein
MRRDWTEGSLVEVLTGRAGWSGEAAEALIWLDRLAALAPYAADLVSYSPDYSDCRLGGRPVLTGEAWVAYQYQVGLASLRVTKKGGLLAVNCDGPTRGWRWEALPHLLAADLYRSDVCTRHDLAYVRDGTPGGCPDWPARKWEFVLCFSHGGRLDSDPKALGHPPKFPPGGNPSHRQRDGSRVGGRAYKPPEVCKVGDVLDVGPVGGNNMGDAFCHETEAPFAEQLAEYLVLTFSRPGGLVVDPFMGSGTTAKAALRNGRRFAGCDIRPSQVDLTRRRLAAAAAQSR